MTNKKRIAFRKLVAQPTTSPTLDVAIEWIKKNLSPDEVFNRKELLHWLEENKESLENKYPVREY